jgi:hypothetical protein
MGPWRSVLNELKQLKGSPGSNNLSPHSAPSL